MRNGWILGLALLACGTDGAGKDNEETDKLQPPCGNEFVYDKDEDGFLDVECGGDDCDDGDAAVYPGAEDVCGDGVDADCNGQDASCTWIGSRDLATADATISALIPGTLLGHSMAERADLDGDGVGDIVVGAPGADGGDGAVYVFSGVVSGAHDTDDASAVIRGPAGSGAGAVAVMGDLNADGIDDIVIGGMSADDPGAGPGEVAQGAAWVLRGPIVGEYDLTVQHAAIIRGVGDHAQMGDSITAAGDLNGDGKPDLVVGFDRMEKPSMGGAAVVYAPLAGVIDAYDGMLTAPQLTSGTADNVSGVGDVDGDGLDDLMLGDELDTKASGVVWLVLGPAAGTIDLTTQADAVLRGAPGSGTGRTIEGRVDADGDGYGDVFLGASRESTGGFNAGAVYGLAGPLAGEIDVPSAAFATVFGKGSREQAMSACAPGDVNGDAVDDLVVGAPSNRDPELGGGYVFLGPVEGSQNTEQAQMHLVPGADSQTPGWTAAAGDLDGDGLADFLISDPLAANGGVTYLFLGAL